MTTLAAIHKEKNMGRERNQHNRSAVEQNDTEVPTRMRAAGERIRSYLKEYCASSGVHGFRYLSEGGRNVFERLFWATAIAVSVCGCAMMIGKIKTKMDTTPMIISLAENPTKVWHVPFPAVTICPGSAARLTAFNLTDYRRLRANKKFYTDFFNWVNERKISQKGYNSTFESPSDYDAEMPWLSNATMRNSLYKKLWALSVMPGRYLLTWYPGTETLPLDEEDMEFLVEVAPKMNNGKHFREEFGNNFFYWKGLYWALDEHFKHVWTDFGLCYTFNMMDDIHVYRNGIVNNDVFKRKGLDKNFPKSSNDWDPDKGYSNILKVYTYPWRAPHERHQAENTLNIMMTENEDDMEEYMGKGSSYYTILFHQPQDHPVLTQSNAISMPFYKYMDISIRINVMTTSPGLKDYDPHKRQCYYSDEKRLEYFKFYSQRNCQLECLTNISLKMCGCAQFYMPRYRTTKICGEDAGGCFSKALANRDLIEISAILKYLAASGKSPYNLANTHAECDCLPNCLSVSYGADVLTTRDMSLDVLAFANTSPPKPGEKFAPAGAYIRMESSSFTATQRSEYYGKIDFLANCGGFLGLFCGFSLLSLVEIIYFLTIRLWTNMCRRRSSLKLQPGLPEDVPAPEDPAPVPMVAFDVPPGEGPKIPQLKIQKLLRRRFSDNYPPNPNARRPTAERPSRDWKPNERTDSIER